MRKINLIILFTFWLHLLPTGFSQGVAINNLGANPDTSAILDVSSITKGTLIPRLTTVQRDAIVNPAQSLWIYNTTTQCFEFWANSAWKTMGCACDTLPANAGSDINPACGVSTATLAGNTPTVGTGTWSVVSGTATITTPSSPTSGITGLTVPGTATLRWTISNPPCTDSYDEVVITTTACFTCGGTLTINHIVGAVAPVTKSVNYGTVSTTLGGTGAKCWITQNLGSDHQATSVADTTEASAGWYWQFNRKQGFKHDGTTRTPNTTWINPISETSDWLATNDPCTIELGTGWRIPTYTEWFNADATGGWDNSNETYASVLKLHPAGAFDCVSLILMLRGSTGYYWSSTQYNATQGGYLIFDELLLGSLTGNMDKAVGNSVRCIKD